MKQYTYSDLYVAVWNALGEGSKERQHNFLFFFFTWYVPMTTQCAHSNSNSNVPISWIAVITRNILLLL